MKGNLGRTRRVSCLAVTGNKQGLGGFALAKSVETKAALRKAKNRAGQKLIHIQRYNDHTGKLFFVLYKIYSSHFINLFQFVMTSSLSLDQQKFMSLKNLKVMAWCAIELLKQYVK